MSSVALNSKQTNKIVNQLKEQFGIEKFPVQCVVFFKRNDNKLFLVSDGLKQLEPVPRYLNSIGMYFATEEPSGIRLSLEGSQIIGPFAKKNVFEINKKQLKAWFNGIEMSTIDEDKGYLIIKYENDFVGCGYKKEKKVLNYIPKNRRVTELF